jgi:hypothetical protein
MLSSSLWQAALLLSCLLFPESCALSIMMVSTLQGTHSPSELASLSTQQMSSTYRGPHHGQNLMLLFVIAMEFHNPK